MPLDFPTSPVNGQTYDNYYWDASTSAWRNNGSKNALSQRLTSLEALPQSSLVPITPTSISVSSGTASSSGSGLVTFSSATNLTLNGVFTSAFSHYKILIDFTNSVIGEVNYSRMSLSGTPSTANSYKIRGTQQTSNTSPTNWGFDATAFTFGRGAGDSAISLDVFNPQSVKRTRINGQMFGYVSNETAWTFSGTLDTNVQYDGFNLYPNTGNITGTIQVYGYRN